LAVNVTGWALRQWRAHPYVAMIVRRIVSTFFLLWGMTLIAFALTHIVPQDPVLSALGERLAQNPAVVKAFKQKYGLDQSITQQYVTYMVGLVHGDLGRSYLTTNNVRDDLGRYIPATFELGIVATTLGLVGGTALGVVTGMRPGRWLDQAARLFSIITISAPLFWIAYIAIYLFSFKLSWFPSGGQLRPESLPPTHVTGAYIVDALITGDVTLAWEALQYVALPAIVLALPLIGMLSRFTRTTVISVTSNEFVIAARAKGLPERTVVLRYILRAALTPIITLFGLIFADVMTGAVLIEVTFSWAGVGQYAYRGAINLDLQVIVGVALFTALVYVVTNLVVDLLYGWVDPRARPT
jgi:peptide/nickel transport system permease protein